MVLAHSLRDNGSDKHLAVLATFDSLQASTIEELKVLLGIGSRSGYLLILCTRQSMILSYPSIV